MSFEARWDASGVKINTASKAFIQSAPKAIVNLSKHEAKINSLFQQHISDNMMRSGIEADNFNDVFAAKIQNGNINFINTEPLITQRYEYGYYDGSKDTNEEYYEEYMVETSPRYFIRPAIQETLNDVGSIILEEAKKEYVNNREEEEWHEGQK